jgi:hypothetical protein
MTQEATYPIETFNRLTGEVERRQITPISTPQRLTKPAPLTLDEIKSALIETGNEVDAAQGQYKTDTESLDAFYAEQKSLREEIAELHAKLNEKQAALRKLEERGTPRDIYAASIVSLERQVTAYAGHLLAALREQAAQRIFGVGFQELTSDGQRDAQARYRKALGRFISPGYTSLGRTHDKATVEQIDRRADQLLDDLDHLLTAKDFFNQD